MVWAFHFLARAKMLTLVAEGRKLKEDFSLALTKSKSAPDSKDLKKEAKALKTKFEDTKVDIEKLKKELTVLNPSSQQGGGFATPPAKAKTSEMKS